MMTAETQTPHVALSSEVERELEETGYIVLRQAISGDELRAAKDWIATETASGQEVNPALQPTFEADGALRKIRRIGFCDPGFWQPWIERTGLAELAVSQLGADCGLILHAAFNKPAYSGTAVVPHQDQALWDNAYPGALTAWVALEEATIENGCLEMYPQSHKRGIIPHDIREAENWHDAIDIAAERMTAEPIPMAAGDVIVWHRYMAHSSGPNTSNKRRQAMVMVFADMSAAGFNAYDTLPVAALPNSAQ